MCVFMESGEAENAWNPLHHKARLWCKLALGLALAVLLGLLCWVVPARAITVTWAPVPDAATYEVLRNGEVVATVTHDEAAVAEVADCTTGERYRALKWSSAATPRDCRDTWEVRAVDACGNKGGSGAAVMCPLPAPARVVSGP